jgi:hypothetical protein
MSAGLEDESRALSRRQLLAAGTALPLAADLWLSAPPALAQATAGDRLTIEVQPAPSPQADLDAVAQAFQAGAAQRRAGARNLRVLSVQEIDPEERGKSAAARAASAGRWRAVSYDYSNQRTLVSEGRLGDTVPDREYADTRQVNPSPAEWDEARDLLSIHPEIGPRLNAGALIAYRPMPPIVTGEGGRRRLVTVGLLPRLPGGDFPHEIVGVDLAGGPVQRFAARAPATSAAGPAATCGAPLGANQSRSGRGLAGQYAITIRRGGTVYWTLTAVRPSASSGNLGSDVELRDVYYRGRKVLHRAHLPILNVKYDGDACGPYRDWQYDESYLLASGTNVAPGFRLASSQPETIIQSGNDRGNFLGTAVWTNGEETTLTAELEAGWYRYISQWTFHTNGTIKPRFGFAAVQNNCVCNVHHHHAYWRLDFDIGGAGRNFVQRSTAAGWSVVPKESVAFRDTQLKTRWRVGNRDTGKRYEIRPGANDGTARGSSDWPFPVGDLWFLRYRAEEIDDHNLTKQAGLNRFVQDQSIYGTDLVVWYASHFTHDQGAEQEAGGADHIVGPDLVPVNW